MTTGNGDRILQKALLYVFAKHRSRVISVDVGSSCYYVKCEFANQPGKYYIVEYPFEALNDIDKEIKEALSHLNWIADGNEFPE